VGEAGEVVLQRIVVSIYCNTQCNTHCNTCCNAYCSTQRHMKPRCNTHCNTCCNAYCSTQRHMKTLVGPGKRTAKKTPLKVSFRGFFPFIHRYLLTCQTSLCVRKQRDSIFLSTISSFSLSLFPSPSVAQSLSSLLSFPLTFLAYLCAESNECKPQRVCSIDLWGMYGTGRV